MARAEIRKKSVAGTSPSNAPPRGRHTSHGSDDPARDRPLSRLRVQGRMLGQQDATGDVQTEYFAVDQ